jgi:hypothetical protein
LDNSGDIILDAVLTDTGRYRLAKGDGSFKIAKFALGDDEINYRLYDKNNTSGSAYYDLNILQTPILEAFTDNAAGLKTKLMTISRNNLLYLPILKLNDLNPNNARYSSLGAFVVAVDSATERALTSSGGNEIAGVLKGVNIGGNNNFIRVDQGLDTNQISPATSIDSDLLETQYIIEIDNNLGSIAQQGTNNVASVSYIDDDNIASYFFSQGTDTGYVQEISTDSNNLQAGQVIQGPRGTKMMFSIKSSTQLQTSTYLFDQLGSTTTINSVSVQYIDTNVRVIGATTGYHIDIPVRFVKV